MTATVWTAERPVWSVTRIRTVSEPWPAVTAAFALARTSLQWRGLGLGLTVIAQIPATPGATWCLQAYPRFGLKTGGKW